MVKVLKVWRLHKGQGYAYSANMSTWKWIPAAAYISNKEYKSCLYWLVNCFSGNFHSVESGLRRSKCHVLGSHCYIWKYMFLSGTKSGVREHHPSLRPPLPFLSSFPPEWYRVFCLPAQVSGKLRLSSINAPNYQTKDDEAAHYYGWPT